LTVKHSVPAGDHRHLVTGRGDHDRMATGGLYKVDVACVQRWCADQVPEHARGEIRVECDVAPRHLTICECRPRWREDLDWTRFPILPPFRDLARTAC
jgi:hypothetical protein